MKTKSIRVIIMVIAAVTLSHSCTKKMTTDLFSWNALAFTEAETSEFTFYMNLPYINITYPSFYNGNKIIYKNGERIISGQKYVFSAHNWGEERIIVTLVREGKEHSKTELTPIAIKPTSLLKQFNYMIEVEPGNYSMKISVKDNRGSTKLNCYPLHSSNKTFTVTAE